MFLLVANRKFHYYMRFRSVQKQTTVNLRKTTVITHRFQYCTLHLSEPTTKI